MFSAFTPTHTDVSVNLSFSLLQGLLEKFCSCIKKPEKHSADAFL